MTDNHPRSAAVESLLRSAKTALDCGMTMEWDEFSLPEGEGDDL